MARIGVVPSPDFPRLSAHNWPYHRPNSASRSQYGIKTVVFTPFVRSSPTETAAPRAGVKSAVAPSSTDWKTRAAPALMAVISSPAIAAGSNPVTDNAEYLPPTCGSWSKTLQPMFSAMETSGLGLGSVITATWSETRSSVTCVRRVFDSTTNCAIVSAVDPDFEIAITPVRVQSVAAIRRSKLCGSTLSTKRSRGPPQIFGYSSGASALRVLPPSDEPPVPKTITSSKFSRKCAAASTISGRSSCFAGNDKNGSFPSPTCEGRVSKNSPVFCRYCSKVVSSRPLSPISDAKQSVISSAKDIQPHTS